MGWSSQDGLSIGKDLKAQARESLTRVAGWAVRNQVRHQWPRWNANTGRFPYHVHLPTDDHFWSTSWNTARMVQGLLSAYQVLGNEEYLFAAECGLEYVKSIQFFGPELPEAHGFFIAETPLSDHGGVRDSIECAQALVAHHLLTGDRVSLQRGRAFLDRFVAMTENGTWPELPMVLLPRLKPSHFIVKPYPKRTLEQRWCDFVCALPLLQLAALTRETKYTAAAERLGDLILTHLAKPDGRLCAPNSGHHTSSADGALDNDDGIALTLVALYKATGRECYLDAAKANADWWLARREMPQNYSALTLLTMIVADLARATGEKRYVNFLRERAPEVFALQIARDERPLVSGAFRGEDMAYHYRQGSQAGDFISLRSTSYGALALGRLACGAEREWSPTYSAFGW
jgi:hypothetical protein